MNILDRFTSIDDLLMSLLERLGGVTEEDTHFFSYPNDGTRATITKGTTTLDFMSGTVMTPAGLVSTLGNSLRARGREYCRSLSLQADRDIIIQIGTKSKIPVFAGTWFKVAHLRFTDLKIIAAESTRIFAIACTNPDSIEMAGETYVKDPADEWGKTTTIGLAELAARMTAPPLTFERRGEVLRWVDFESGTPDYYVSASGVPLPTHSRSTDVACDGDFSYKIAADNNCYVDVEMMTNDFHGGRIGNLVTWSTDDDYLEIRNRVSYFSGTAEYRGEVRYNTVTGTLVYLNSVGATTTLSTSLFYKKMHSFSRFKIVVNVGTGKYVRIMAFGNEYDISDQDMWTAAAGTHKHINAISRVAGIGAGVHTAYIHNMILTENEPL